MVHIYNGILLMIKRNKIESIVVRWMNLEPVTQSEVSQKEKNKYHILTHIYGIQKMVLMNIFAGQEWRHRCREQIYGCSGGRRGWVKSRSSIDIHTLPFVKQIASRKQLYSTGSSTWCSVMTQRGGMGCRRDAQEGGDIWVLT